MFTEGLDRSARNWVSASEKENSHPRTNLGARADPVMGTRKGSHGLGLPAISRFQSGHLPSNAIPLTRIINGDADGNFSVSDSDMVTDSEEEMSRQSQSLDSSPPSERVPIGPSSQYANLLRRRPQYGSDSLYSDVSSSVETVGSRQKKMPERAVRGNGRYPVEWKGCEDDELSDSLSSSEFSTTHTGSINGVPPVNRPHNLSSVASGLQAKRSVEKGSTKNIKREDFSDDDDDDMPSAPPLCGSVQEMNQEINVAAVEEQSKPEKKTSLNTEDDGRNKNSKNLDRNIPGAKTAFPGSHPPRLPVFHASALGPWHAVIAYDACVRLCLNAWARGCKEAPMFLEDECLMLRDAFGLLQTLLRSEEEILANQSSKHVNEGSTAKTKKIVGKIKVQVRRVKTVLDPPTGCGILSIKSPSSASSIRHQLSNLHSAVASQWQSVRKANGISQNSSRYINQVSGLIKTGVTSLRNSSSSYDLVQETFTCLLRLKSSTEEDVIPMKPGSGEMHVFFPDSAGDDLIIEVLDSKAKHYGRVLVQVATVSDEPGGDKLRWWSIYREPEHELVGKLQLSINYSTSCEETSNLKYGTVAETVAYDLALEVAMKVQGFQQRKLFLDGPWKWLLLEFASYYGISDIYTKLRYLSYIMDVATPTADCLTLVYDLLMPVVMKGHTRSTLSHQENRILGDVKDQIEQILSQVFENYKSLDESLFSGIMEVFQPSATGVAAPALDPAVKLYTLLHDVLSPEAQNKLCQYFQVAAKKRSRRHLRETDEYVASSVEGTEINTMSTAYQKMSSLCINLKNEIFTDIEIHNKDILPSFVDLPNLTSPIYATELSNRLCAFLTAIPPLGPSPPVAELIVATADFQRDLAGWKISPVKGGVNAKELFNLYILVWIQDKRASLLETCKLDKIKWSGVTTQHSTTPFVDEMYDRLREMLSSYEVIICRWPDYSLPLENAIADVEKAIVDALDKQYMDVLAPLKENITPKKFGFKYVHQKLTKRSVSTYTVPEELGILLNSMKRMLDVLHPRIESQFRSWGSFMPNSGNTAPGDRLSEVAVMLRTKFRNYLQAIVEKLLENSKTQAATKMKKVLQDSKGAVVESDVRGRIEPLREQLTDTINHLHTIFGTNVFVAICRGYWDKMGKEILSFLESRKENRSWYKGSQIAVLVLDDTFASQMQRLLGNALQAKDMEPPGSIMEVRSILCKDGPTLKNRAFY